MSTCGSADSAISGFLRANIIFSKTMPVSGISKSRSACAPRARYRVRSGVKISIRRQDETVWQARFYSGEENTCHSLANLEYHHFKYEAHRDPGDVHIHFFGADAFSFGEGVRLENGDSVEIEAPALGKPLQNFIRIEQEKEQPVRVAVLA